MDSIGKTMLIQGFVIMGGTAAVIPALILGIGLLVP